MAKLHLTRGRPGSADLTNGADDTPPERVEDKPPSSWGLVAVLCLCGTLTAMQHTLVIPLLPDLPRTLDTSSANASWVVTITLLSGAIATPVVSRLADMHGRRPMLIISVGGILVGSVICAVADNIVLALFGRALHGLGSGIVPIAMAVMKDVLPSHRVPLAVALMSATQAIGAGAGLTLAGVVAGQLGWNALWWLTAGSGLLLLPLLLATVPRWTSRVGGAFDYSGAALLSLALVGGLLVVTKGPAWGYVSATTLVCLSLGVVGFATWVPLSLRHTNPLVNLRSTLRIEPLLLNAIGLLAGCALFANLLVSAQLLQLPKSTGYGLGLDATEAGLWMAPTALAFGVFAPIFARVSSAVGPRVTLLVGTVVMAVAYGARAVLSSDLAQIVGGSIVVAAGTAATLSALPLLVMASVPPTETAAANGVNVLMRAVGTALSSAYVAAVANDGMTVGGQIFPSFDSLMVVFWSAAGISTFAGVLAFLLLALRRPTAEPVA